MMPTLQTVSCLRGEGPPRDRHKSHGQQPHGKREFNETQTEDKPQAQRGVVLPRAWSLVDAPIPGHAPFRLGVLREGVPRRFSLGLRVEKQARFCPGAPRTSAAITLALWIRAKANSTWRLRPRLSGALTRQLRGVWGVGRAGAGRRCSRRQPVHAVRANEAEVGFPTFPAKSPKRVLFFSLPSKKWFM